MIVNFINKTTKSIEDVNIIENSFDFLCGLLRFSENYNDLEKFILSQKQNEFKVLSTYGLLNSNYRIFKTFIITKRFNVTLYNSRPPTGVPLSYKLIEFPA